MTTKAQEAQTAVALACGAALATEVILRMPRNKISHAVDGNVLTRTNLSVHSLNVIAAELQKNKEEAQPALPL